MVKTVSLRKLNLIQTARNKWGHIKKLETLPSFEDGFQDTLVGKVLWFNDGNNGTHIVGEKDLCPECHGPLNFPSPNSNGYCTICHNHN